MNNTIGIHYEMPDGVIAFVTGWDSRKKLVTYHCDAENSGGTIPEEEWHTWKPREDLRDFPNARDPRLPYVFDLNWDIKHMSQLALELIDGDDVTAIRAMMREHDIVVPGDDAPRTNVNCLEGLKCPQCGQSDRLLIEGTSVFEVVDDGTESHSSVEWNDSSVTQCPECHLGADLKHFQIKPENEDKTYEVVVYARSRYTANIEGESPEEAVRTAKEMLVDVGLEEDSWVRDNDFYELDVKDDPEEVEDVKT